MSPKVKAAVIDFMRSNNIFRANGSVDHEAYAAECRLFSMHFKGMSPEETADYTKFTMWLDSTGMLKSDLLMNEIFDLYQTNLKAIS